ncbi:MAG TPA: methylenetetrahydrofolate--tRNA-(uracil(54)-C(5))-methyltransferase (FADH(2)-oxidizing) TrmFO [Thermodesulfobacteriota bacterium]|nr:methylenetetrahydrofolate--tRNA-(uracil(54)-C(5))-methyltransferase (FADH(2)-oxidizing) TrmFO [Thermodesulfobacteriota bacterium]
MKITIIGGGLSGCEAAWQGVKQNIPVRLLEMKPLRYSPAHHSPFLAELVCSNSFRSQDPDSAVGLLKAEMELLGSLVMESARAHQVPAGKALAVDRQGFAQAVTERIKGHPLIEVVTGEIRSIPENLPLIIASGPLTTEALAQDLSRLIGASHLYFYDAIAPIVYKETIDFKKAYLGSRYGHGGDDYINCPMTEESYSEFLNQLLQAEKVPLHPFEKINYFEGCLPIEVMAERGRDTLRFGPMKPVGLPDPKTGQTPFAVVQLRQDNQEGTLYNLVGFQTKLKWPEQERIFRMIPGLERAEFARLGSIHRNTFVHGPEVLMPTLQLKKNPAVFLAGQITGVEGYVESTAMGLLAGINASRFVQGITLAVPPPTTALGALVSHVSREDKRAFQPVNVNFGIFQPLQGKVPKRFRGQAYRERALNDLKAWMADEKLI